jgi:hypothetical protein
VIANRNTIGNIGSSSVSVASTAAFHQGIAVVKNNQRNFSISKTSVGTTNVVMFTLRNKLIHNNRANFSLIKPIYLNFTNYAGQASEVFLVENAALNNTAKFVPLATNSTAEIDVSGTSYTNGVVRASYGLNSSNQLTIDLQQLGLNVESNSTLSVICRATSAANTSILATLQWLEDI